jgi:hypothetical protein
MAYVPGYQWDVFVSYARYDDKPMIPGERGWVSTFVNALKVGVRNYLGEDIRLFFDLSEAQPGMNQLEDLKRAAAASATMVAIASPTYCRREWTMAELETFNRACPDLHRLLVVERLPLGGDDSWPDLLGQKIRMPFWEEMPNTAAKAPLSPASGAYLRLLMDFAHRLQEQLRRLRAPSPGPRPPIPGKRPARPEPPPGPQPARRTILLAQATDDVADEVESLRRWLAQYPDMLAVLPEGAYPQGGEAFREAFEQDLASADMFVQLLGARAGRAPPDLPEGYTRFQLERARAAGKTVLQWRHPDLDLAAIADEGYRALVGDAGVTPCGLEEFKRQIRDRAGESDPEPLVCDKSRVFISADRANLITAEAIAVEFSANQYQPALPKFDGSTRENRNYLYRMMSECGVVLVVNGVRPPIWFDNQKKLFDVLRPARASEPEGLAVCSVPPADELGADLIGGDFVHIDCSDGYDPDRVRNYIASLRQRRQPPGTGGRSQAPPLPVQPQLQPQPQQPVR